jgi:hypothetical protein
MGFTTKILGRPQILTATFTSGEAYTLRLGGEVVVDPDTLKARVGKTLLIVVACGYGVICKDVTVAPEVAAKVTAPDSGFVWRREGDTICFVRGAQFERFADLQPLAITCAAAPEEAEKVAGEIYAREVSLRNTAKPSPQSSLLASLLARRLQLPFLGLVLLLLTINAAVSSGVQSRLQAAQAQRTALEKRIGKAGDVSRERAQAVADWDRTLPRNYAWLMDRTAAALPRGIALQSLSVQPLLKNIEQGRTPLFSEREMVVAGQTSDSGSVSEYATALDSLKIARGIRLSTVEYDREKGVYNFRINIEL